MSINYCKVTDGTRTVENTSQITDPTVSHTLFLTKSLNL